MFGSMFTGSTGAKNKVMTTGEPGWFSRFTGGHSNSGMVVDEQVARSCNDVWTCSTFIRNMISVMTQGLKKNLPDGFKQDVTSGPIYDLIRKPNSEMNRQTYLSLMIDRLVNLGNAYAWIKRDPYTNYPVELWPIHNSRVTFQRDHSGTPYWEIAVDDFHSQDFPWRLDFEDLFNGIWCVKDDGITGTGVFEVGVEEIALNLSAQEYGSKFYQNGAKPNGHVEMETFLKNPDQIKIFRDDIERIHQGRANWQKPGILWGGKWKESQVSPDKAMMLETREFSAKQLCHMYGTPPALVGYDENQKYNNFEVLMRQFGRTTALAIVTTFEIAYEFYILPEGYEFDIDMSSVLRGDPVEQNAIFTTQRQLGVKNADEWRKATNQNPIGGDVGKKYILPLNHAGAEEVIEGKNLKVQMETSKNDD